MSFLNNIGLLFSATEKVLNNFKSRARPIINQDKTLATPEPATEPTNEPAPNPKVFDTLIHLKLKEEYHH